MRRRISSLDHNSSPGSSGRRPIRRIQDHSDTQRSLHEASVALENAFDRIRNVRRNLLRLAETLPEPLTTGSSNSDQDSVDPGHEALVLSGGTTEEPEQDVSNVTLDTREVDGATSTLSRSPSPTHSLSTMAMDPPNLVQARPLPSILPPRFSRQSIYGLSPDSAATTHGLRVAAREAANSTANNHRMFGVTPRDPGSDAVEFERLLARGPIASGAAQDPPIPDAFRFQSVTRGRPNHVSVVAPPVFPASVPPNVYQYRVDTLMATPDPTNRLNYLPLPPAPPPGRPIQRPLSHLPSSPGPRPTPASMVGSSDGYDNENLTEYQFISWLFPSQDYASSLVPRQDPHNPDTIRITRANGPTPSHPELEPRRRGWARLDLDGNEIPWDEEEELERSRTEYRLRVLQSTHEGSNGPEILRHDGRTFHGSVLDSMLSVPATQPRTDQWRSATTADTQTRPFWVDPLPMPLSSMIMKEENQDDYHPDVIVPRHACFAGR